MGSSVPASRRRPQMEIGSNSSTCLERDGLGIPPVFMQVFPDVLVGGRYAACIIDACLGSVKPRVVSKCVPHVI
jgi:hypothetical protein